MRWSKSALHISGSGLCCFAMASRRPIVWPAWFSRRRARARLSTRPGHGPDSDRPHDPTIEHDNAIPRPLDKAIILLSRSGPLSGHATGSGQNLGDDRDYVNTAPSRHRVRSARDRCTRHGVSVVTASADSANASDVPGVMLSHEYGRAGRVCALHASPCSRPRANAMQKRLSLGSVCNVLKSCKFDTALSAVSCVIRNFADIRSLKVCAELNTVACTCGNSLCRNTLSLVTHAPRMTQSDDSAAALYVTL